MIKRIIQQFFAKATGLNEIRQSIARLEKQQNDQMAFLYSALSNRDDPTDPYGRTGWVKPWEVTDIKDCLFYHAVDLPGYGVIDQGLGWDLRERYDDYIGHVDVKGKSFLDIGAASGFISFEAERRGAIVTSFDLDSGHRRQAVPKAVIGDMGLFLQGSDGMYRTIKNSYWFAHRALQSKARAYYGNIFRFPDDFGPFDVVFLGQVLVHLRDPMQALVNAARVCRDTLIITEGMYESDQPTAVFLSGPDNDNYDAWWHLSTKLYTDFLKVLGFEVVSITRNKYRATHQALAGEVDVPTLVARRIVPLPPAAR